MSQKSNEEILLELARANVEDDVHRILSTAGLLADEYWRPYGGVANNSGAFQNQQASPRGALVEKITNSIDAVLMKHAHAAGDLPVNSRTPQSMFEAAARYLQVPRGRLAELTPTERTRIANDSVQVVFSGHRSPARPTITITDKGEGQAPANFPTTLVSLSQNNKMLIPFVQGKFKMGSTGAAAFCGAQHQYQLIVSRRNASCPGDSSAWGFTVVRRKRPTGNERSSQFQYLAPNGLVLTVPGKPLPLWATDRGPYEDVESGTLVRLYEYDIPDKTVATIDFSRMLDRRLYRLPIPVLVVETRSGFRGHSLTNTVPGLETRLSVDRADVVEPNFPARADIQVEKVGAVSVNLVPFQAEAQAERWVRPSEAVIFTVNGQAHAFEDSRFLRGRRVGLDYLATSLLVEVDCSRLSAAVIDDLFMGSRDRMRENDAREALIGEIESFLRDHKGLRDLNHQRKLEAQRKAIESDTKTKDLFRALLRSTPELAALLMSGEILGGSRTTRPSPTLFEGKPYPTFLDWHRGTDGQTRECPKNRPVRLEFKTDAANDFFGRAVDPGECSVGPNDWRRGESLWNGILSVSLRPPEDAKVGDRIPFRLEVVSSASGPLMATAWLVVTEPVDTEGPPDTPRPPRGTGVAEPDIREVHRNMWSTPGFGFDARSVAKVEQLEGATTIYVNMDNDALLGHLGRHIDRAEEIKYAYKISRAAIGMAFSRANRADAIDEAAAEEAVKCLGDILAPLVDFVSRGLGVQAPD